MRDAHTDNTYTATTEFEYTRGRNVSGRLLKRSNVRVLTLRGDDVYGTVNQRVGLQDSPKTYEYELPRVISATYADHGCQIDYAARTTLVNSIKQTDIHIVANLVNSPAESMEISQPLTSRGDVRLPVLIAKEMRRSRIESVLNKYEYWSGKPLEPCAISAEHGNHGPRNDRVRQHSSPEGRRDYPLEFGHAQSSSNFRYILRRLTELRSTKRWKVTSRNLSKTSNAKHAQSRGRTWRRWPLSRWRQHWDISKP